MRKNTKEGASDVAHDQGGNGAERGNSEAKKSFYVWLSSPFLPFHKVQDFTLYSKSINTAFLSDWSCQILGLLINWLKTSFNFFSPLPPNNLATCNIFYEFVSKLYNFTANENPNPKQLEPSQLAPKKTLPARPVSNRGSSWYTAYENIFKFDSVSLKNIILNIYTIQLLFLQR